MCNDRYQPTDEEIKTVNKACRSRGAVGKMALLPRWIREIYPPDPNRRILDFGCGKDAIHTIALREKGYNIQGYELGNNVNPDLHLVDLTGLKFDVIFASNVLNIQRSVEMAIWTLQKIRQHLADNGVAYLNHPESPRYHGLTEQETTDLLREIFPGVHKQRVNKTIVYSLTK